MSFFEESLQQYFICSLKMNSNEQLLVRNDKIYLK